MWGRPRSAGEPDRTRAGRRGHGPASSGLTGSEVGKVGQPQGHIPGAPSSPGTSLAREAPSQSQENQAAAPGEHGSLGMTSPPRRPVRPAVVLRLPRAPGHWCALARWHRASDPKESHPARGRRRAAILGSGACKQPPDLGTQQPQTQAQGLLGAEGDLDSWLGTASNCPHPKPPPDLLAVRSEHQSRRPCGWSQKL